MTTESRSALAGQYAIVWDTYVTRFGLRLPPNLTEFLSRAWEPNDPLRALAYRTYVDPSVPPSVLWAIAAIRSGQEMAPRSFIPILPFDSRSFACFVLPSPETPVEFHGTVRRWHLDATPARAQAALIDPSLERFIGDQRDELTFRQAGLDVMKRISSEFDARHGAQDHTRRHEARPIRLAAQNVIVGLSAFYHDSDIDALRVLAWQTCQVPHLDVHEGCRGLLGMTLAEAFQAGGTMEIRFDRHPEGRVPAAIRMYARVHNLSVGAEDPQSVVPREARDLFQSVLKMPAALTDRVARSAADGSMTPERACFVQLAGIWKPIELDYLLATSARAGSIIRGGVDPLDRRQAQAEFEAARSAILVGTLFARLSRPDDAPSRTTKVIEDARESLSWSVLPEHAAILLENLDPAQTLPWTSTAETTGSKRLLVVPRSWADKRELQEASALGDQYEARAAVLVPADGSTPSHDVGAAAVLRHPDDSAELDRQINARLLACRVGRA